MSLASTFEEKINFQGLKLRLCRWCRETGFSGKTALYEVEKNDITREEYIVSERGIDYLGTFDPSSEEYFEIMLYIFRLLRD